MLRHCMRCRSSTGFDPHPMEFLVAHYPSAVAAASDEAEAEDPAFDDPTQPLLAKGAVLVLSEFVACSTVLRGSLQINPWSTDNVASIIDKVCCAAEGGALCRPTGAKPRGRRVCAADACVPRAAGRPSGRGGTGMAERGEAGFARPSGCLVVPADCCC